MLWWGNKKKRIELFWFLEHTSLVNDEWISENKNLFPWFSSVIIYPLTLNSLKVEGESASPSGLTFHILILLGKIDRRVSFDCLV